MTSQITVETRGALGCITLNRPEAINALSFEMIAGITAALTSWAIDPAVGAVLFRGAGTKGFCAGGDVRAVRTQVLAGQLAGADDYFAAEYHMNGLIAGYRKPIVALTHGVVMGGGIGIAGHCAIRITQPGSRFAMPESAIGFFADVGVNAILAKAPLHRALLFLLSGVTVGPADALALGLADAVMPADRVDSFCSDLESLASHPQPRDAIGRRLIAESIDAGDANFCALPDQLPAGAGVELSAFLAAVAATPRLADVAALLAARCPASLFATHAAQHAARRHMDVHRTLVADLRLAQEMARRPDFAEGVRAVLVDKDQKPHWTPPALELLPPGWLCDILDNA